MFIRKSVFLIPFLIILLFSYSNLNAGKAPVEYNLAYQVYQQKNYDLAIEKFREFVELYPDHFYTGNGYYWLGIIFYKQKNYYDAIIEFEKVTTCKNIWKYPDAYMRIGLSYKNLKKYDKAIAEFTKIVNKYETSKDQDHLNKVIEAKNLIKVIKKKIKK